MASNLSPNDEAYNAAVVALNDAEERLLDAFHDRQRAWDACQALNPIGTHGARSTFRSHTFEAGDV